MLTATEVNWIINGPGSEEITLPAAGEEDDPTPIRALVSRAGVHDAGGVPVQQVKVFCAKAELASVAKGQVLLIRQKPHLEAVEMRVADIESGEHYWNLEVV